MGVGGGVAMAILGVLAFLRAGNDDSEDEDVRFGAGTRNLVRLIGAGLLSPAPWVFWTAIGGPLLLRYWNRGPGDAALFLGGFFGLFIGAQVGVAFGASRGARLLRDSWRRRATRAVSLVLVLAGGVLAWQSWTGSFQQFIETQREVRKAIE